MGRSQSTTRKLRELIAALRDVPIQEHEDRLTFTFDEADDLVDHGEEGVAFELLCDNLYEFDFPLSPESLQVFRELAPLLSPGTERLSFLSELINGT